MAGAEAANASCQLPALHPRRQSQAAALAPGQGLSSGHSPVPGWQPALPCHPGTARGTHGVQGAGHGAVAGVGVPSGPCSGCFLPGMLCLCGERGVRLHPRAAGATFLLGVAAEGGMSGCFRL